MGEEQGMAGDSAGSATRERDLDRLVLAAVNLPWLESFDEPDRLIEALSQL
jgi:hypothetical protein